MFRIEAPGVFAYLVLPFDLAELSLPLPLSKEHFIRVLVPLLNQLGLVGEEVVELATAITTQKNISKAWSIKDAERASKSKCQADMVCK